MVRKITFIAVVTISVLGIGMCVKKKKWHLLEDEDIWNRSDIFFCFGTAK